MTLAGTLAAGGSNTQCVGKMNVFPSRNLLGFHHVVLHDGYMHPPAPATAGSWAPSRLQRPWLRERVGQAYAYHNDTASAARYAVRPWMYDTMLHPTAWVTTKGIDFLRRRDPGKPFFLMLSYHRPPPAARSRRRSTSTIPRRPLPPLVTGTGLSRAATHHGLDSPSPMTPPPSTSPGAPTSRS